MKRSSEANRFYFALLSAISEKTRPEGQQYSVACWHEYWKQRLLGCEDVALPNGKTMTVTHSTADLDKGEFQEYVQQIEAWAAERGVYLDEMVEMK